MNKEEFFLFSSLINTGLKQIPDPIPAKGIYISRITDCPRALWLLINKPKEINGKEVTYLSKEILSNSEYVLDMGQSVENTMEKQIQRIKGMELIGTQLALSDLDNKVRGRIDFAVYHKTLGTGVIDTKGMSEKVFSKFKQSETLKKFNEAYYAQVVYYLHLLNCDWGAIVGINRSNGKLFLKMITKEETKEDFEFYRNRCYQIIQAKDIKEIGYDKTCCKFCEFLTICKEID